MLKEYREGMPIENGTTYYQQRSPFLMGQDPDVRSMEDLNFFGMLKMRAMMPAIKHQIEQQQQQQMAQQVQGLIGQPQQKTTQEQMGPMQPGMSPQQITAPIEGTGSGYLGGKIDERELAAGLLGVPGYQGVGMGLLNTMIGNSGAMQRAQLDAALKQNQQYGPFQDYKEWLDAQQAIKKQANTELAPSRESLRKFGQATDIIKARGNLSALTGADDTVLIKAFASMILPGEAVMSDDIRTIVNQNGLPGAAESYIQAFKGKGQLGLNQRTEIYRSMLDLATRANRENQEIRKTYEPDVMRSKFDPASVFRPPMPYEPYRIQESDLEKNLEPYNG